MPGTTRKIILMLWGLKEGINCGMGFKYGGRDDTAIHTEGYPEGKIVSEGR